jgi:5'-3' exonuclease
MSHCLYGLDADLIMLALATHEPHFTVLREKVPQATERFFLPPAHNLLFLLLQVVVKSKKDFEATKSNFVLQMTQQYDFFSVSLLREIIYQEFKMDLPFEYNLERVIGTPLFSPSHFFPLIFLLLSWKKTTSL